MKLVKRCVAITFICMITSSTNAQRADKNFQRALDSFNVRAKRLSKEYMPFSRAIIAPLSKNEAGIIVGIVVKDTTADLSDAYLITSDFLKEKTEKEIIKDDVHFVSFISFSFNYPSGKKSTVFNYKRDGRGYKLVNDSPL